MNIIDEVYKERERLINEIINLENIIENYENEMDRMVLDIKKLKENEEENKRVIKEKDVLIDYLKLLTGDLNLDLLAMEEKLNKSSSIEKLPIEYRIKYNEVTVEDVKGEHWIDIRNDDGDIIARVNIDEILIQKPKYYQKIESNGQYEYRPEQGYAAMSCMPLEVEVDGDCKGMKNEWAFTGFKMDYICKDNPSLSELNNILYQPAYYFNEYFKVLSNSVVYKEGEANSILFKIEKEVNNDYVIWNCTGELVYDKTHHRFILFFVDMDYKQVRDLEGNYVKCLKWGMFGEYYKLINYFNLVVKRIKKSKSKKDNGKVYELNLNLTVQKCNRYSSYKNNQDRVSIQTMMISSDPSFNNSSTIQNVYLKDFKDVAYSEWPGDDIENFFWEEYYSRNNEVIEENYGLLKYIVIQEEEEQYKNIFNVLMKNFKDYSVGKTF